MNTLKKYIFLHIAGIIFSIISAVNIFANQSLPDLSDSVSEKIGDKTVLIFSRDNGYAPQWFISSASDLVQLKNPPATMNHIYSLKASTDKQYLAVLSADEGHPEIGIFKLAEILADKKADRVYGIDPYPGIVDLIEWKGKYLHITSTLFLTEKAENDGRVPDALTLFSPESFLMDINTGKIEPVSERLQDPVNYYGTHLLVTPDEYSPLTELGAFSELNDINAIPYLEKALKLQRYSKNKKELDELVLTLRKKLKHQMAEQQKRPD